MRILILSLIGVVLCALGLSHFLFPEMFHLLHQQDHPFLIIIVNMGLFFILILDGVLLIRNQSKFKKMYRELTVYKERTANIGDRLTQKIEEINFLLDTNEKMQVQIARLKQENYEKESS